MSKLKRWLLALVPLLVWLVAPSPVAAASLPARPTQADYVDQLNLLDSQTTQLIEQKNQQYQQTKQQPQIAVAVVKSSGESLDDYAPKLFSKWGVGNKSRDNGVLIVFAENSGAQNMRIEVGYGLEGELTDALAKNILEQNIKDIKATSHTKVNTAMRAVFNAVATVIDKKYKFKADANTVGDDQMNSYRQTGNNSSTGSKILTTLVTIFIALVIIVIIIGSGGGPRGGRRSGSGWWLWWLLGSLMSGGSRNRWGGGGRGGYGGGGFGGGGFGGGGGGGGFGGGSSGGGGASV